MVRINCLLSCLGCQLLLRHFSRREKSSSAPSGVAAQPSWFQVFPTETLGTKSIDKRDGRAFCVSEGNTWTNWLLLLIVATFFLGVLRCLGSAPGVSSKHGVKQSAPVRDGRYGRWPWLILTNNWQQLAIPPFGRKAIVPKEQLATKGFLQTFYRLCLLRVLNVWLN